MNWRVFATAWVALSLLTSIWSIATPISAAPDEPAHMVKAASVVRGELVGTWSPTGHIVHVPRYVANTHAEACYAFHSEEAADCVTSIPGDPGELVRTSTTAGLYNPIYYALVGWPTLLIGNEVGIYAMRIASGVLSSLFLALTFMMAYMWRRRTLPVLSLAVAVTPMLLFLDGSVNPNGVEATATLALFVGMLSIVLERTPHLGWHALIVGGAAIIAVNSRGLSPLWVGLALVIPLALLKWRELLSLLRTRAIIWLIVAVGLGTAFAAAWLFGTNSLGTPTIDAGPGFSQPGTGRSPYYGFKYVLENTFSFSQGLVGIFGWLDTPAPPTAYFLWAALTGALVLASLAFLRGRALIVVIVLALAFVLFPAMIQAVYVTDGGIIWQGRYNFPLYVCLIFGLGALLGHIDGHVSPLTLSRFSAVILIAVAAGHVYSFATALRRYSVGYSGSWKAMIIDPEWNAPGGNFLILAAFTILLAGSVVLLHRTIGRDPAMVADALSHPVELR